MNRSRRNFLFGNFRKVVDRSAEIINNKPFILRPPGALPEGKFQAACPPDCDLCIKACPPHVLLPMQDSLSQNNKTPYINPKVGGCEYCPDFPCIKACPHGALTEENKIMGKAELLASCLTKQHQICEICRYACPEGVQALVKDMYGRLQIDLERCVGCAKCVTACFMVPKAVEVFSKEKIGRKSSPSKVPLYPTT